MVQVSALTQPAGSQKSLASQPSTPLRPGTTRSNTNILPNQSPSVGGPEVNSTPTSRRGSQIGTEGTLVRPDTGVEQEPGTIWSFPARPAPADGTHGAKTPRLPGQQIPKSSNHDSASTSHVSWPGYRLWSGSHAEDVLSEQNIRHGFSIKPQLANEDASARRMLWPQLKGEQGLQSVASFFKGLLEEQKARGMISGPSTFKPPPRVTLTDQKKEAWLKDLANPTIPLRKQSRTIPHGVRGKSLLDQCLSKNISMSRAVWLTKCVGANELRAFRRKGVSSTALQENEAKWIEAWTTVVETFVEEHMVALPNTSWRQNLSYVCRFFIEGLLDTDHYRDWVCKSIAKCQFERVPVFLLIAQTLYNSFKDSAKLSQHLVAACLLRWSKLSSAPETEAFASLCRRLENLLLRLLVDEPGAFIFRDDWTAIRSSLQALRTTLLRHNSTSAHSTALIDDTIRRNDRIFSLASNDTQQTHSPYFQLAALFDSAFFIPTSDFVQRGRAIFADPSRLAMETIVVAASRYRSDLSHVYLACRLLRALCSEPNFNLSETLMAGMSTIQHRVSSHSVVARIVAELTRSDHFNSAAYLRHLLSAGDLDPRGRSLDCEILYHLPSSRIAQNLDGLRVMVLRRMGRNANNEDQESYDLKKTVATRIKNVLSAERPLADRDILPDRIPLHNTAQSFAFSHWLHQGLTVVLENAQVLQAFEQKPWKVDSILRLIDTLQDYAQMLSVLRRLVSIADCDGLCSLAIFCEARERILSGLAASTGVWHAILRRYRTLRTSNAPHRELCQTLLRVVPKEAPESAKVYLNQELTFCDANQGIAAYTPVSDGHGESAALLGDDIDQILANGQSMEPPQLTHVLKLLLAVIAKADQEESQISQTSTTLMSLRLTNDGIFQGCLLQALATLPDDFATVRRSLMYLLDLEIFDVAAVFEVLEHWCQDQSSNNGHEAARAVLSCLFPTGTYQAVSSPQALWTQQRRRNEIRDTAGKALLHTVARCTQANLHFLEAKHDSKHDIDIDAVISAMRGWILYQQTDSLQSVAYSLSAFQPQALLTLSTAIVGDLDNDQSGIAPSLAVNSATPILRFLISLIDRCLPDALPIYHFTFSIVSGHVSDEDLQGLYDHLAGANKVPEDFILSTLISAANSSLQRFLRAACEQALISSTTFAATPESEASTSSFAPRFWALVIQATKQTIPNDDDAAFGEALTNQLDRAAQLSEHATLLENESSATFLEALIKVLLVHVKFCASSTLVRVAHSLCVLLGDDKLQMYTNKFLLHILHDAALYIVPQLSSTLLQMLHGKLLKSQALNARILYLLGSARGNLPSFNLVSYNAPWIPFESVTGTGSARIHDVDSVRPFPLRPWELLADAAPHIASNDAPISLSFFDARREPGKA